MGAKCSGRAQASAPNPYAGRTGQEKKYQRGEENGQREAGKVATATPTVEESVEKHLVAGKESPRRPDQYANCSEDEFFDGIPRYQRSSFRNSRSLRSTKVDFRCGSVCSFYAFNGIKCVWTWNFEFAAFFWYEFQGCVSISSSAGYRNYYCCGD